MKAIKITATDDYGNVNTRTLEVAECLMGSKSVNNNILHGTLGCRLLLSYSVDEAITGDEATFPLDTLKVCPFMCMKHGVPVVGKSDEYYEEGIINWINGNEHPILINDTEFLMSEVQLDLTRLYKGCKVVEL